MLYSHKPITLEKLSCVFFHKACFEDFTTIIHPGDRIAIIGPNGSGKTTLLKILAGIMEPTSGSLSGIDFARTGYVPQIQHNNEALSGGESIRKALEQAIANNPSLLLLDEPTNHLDAKNREQLFGLLHSWPGSAIIVTHDTELLRTWPTNLWHIQNGTITIFNGSYDDFVQEQRWDRERAIAQRDKLKQEQKRLKQTEVKQKEKANKGSRNAKNAVLQGRISRLEYSGMKENAEQSSGALKRAQEHKHASIKDQLSQIHIHEELKPHFDLPVLTHKNASIMIREGTVSYENRTVLFDVYMNIQPGERYAILGDNGSGKSTLFKAIMHDPIITKSGSWSCPPSHMIGHIDQRYSLLRNDLIVFDTIKQLQPSWDDHKIRKLLNDFLFRTPLEVAAPIRILSGGERARLSLACIVAQAPSMLLLDEITNNLDLIARQQIIEALSVYPGTLLVISHDKDFLETIGITQILKLPV